MSKPTRSIQEINNAYFRKASELGHLEWQLRKIPGQIASIDNDLKEIDKEMDRAQAAKTKEDQEKARATAEAMKQAKAQQPQEVTQQ